MQKASGKHISLKTKTFRVILIVALIMILIGSSAGLMLYAYSSLENYKSEAKHLIDYSMSMQDMDDIKKLFRETRSMYESMPEEVRSDPFSDEFIGIMMPLADEDFFTARKILEKCRETTGQRNVFLMFTDPENSAMVYVLDGDVEEWAYLPGQWMKEDLDKIESVQDSSWKLIMTHEKEYGWIGTDCEKIFDADGNMIGYAVLDLDLNDFLNRVFGFLIVLLPAALLIIAALASLSGSLLRKHIISHLTNMADAAKDYTAMDKVDLDADTRSVFEPLGINTGDELEDLWLSMTEMEHDVKDSMIRLREMTAEREHVEAELSIAAEIQTGMLPVKFPQDSRFSLYASMDPAKEVGGDLYDFFMIDDDHIALVIADVSGKGVSASLFMVIAKTLIKNQTEQGLQNPGEIFNRVNRQLAEVNKAHMFVTAWLGILTLSTGELAYVDAGHEYPALRRKGGLFEVIEDIHGVPLAARKKMTFDSGSFTLNAGDTLFVYTDGVPEANNTEGIMMEKGRMIDALNRDPDAEPEVVINNVTEGIAEFVKDAPQFDDTTMLCIKYYGDDQIKSNGSEDIS